MYKAVFDNILVRVLETEETTKSGLVIPGIAQERPSEGIVVSVGSYVDTIKDQDHVVFKRDSGFVLKVDGQEHVYLKKDDILGTIET